MLQSMGSQRVGHDGATELNWTASLHLLISRRALNPFMMTSAPVTSSKMGIWLHWTPPSPKSYILTFFRYLFEAVSQSYLRCCLLGYSRHVILNKTQLATLMLCIFFKVNTPLYFSLPWFSIFLSTRDNPQQNRGSNRNLGNWSSISIPEKSTWV